MTLQLFFLPSLISASRSILAVKIAITYGDFSVIAVTCSYVYNLIIDSIGSFLFFLEYKYHNVIDADHCCT